MNRYFDTVWWGTVVGIFVVGLAPFALPWSGWQWVAFGLTVVFLVAEYLSKAVGRSTLTAWVHDYLRDFRSLRISLGVFFALVALVRLPDLGFGLHLWTGGFLMAWLPPHYSRPGFRGMVDDAVHKLLGIRLW